MRCKVFFELILDRYLCLTMLLIPVLFALAWGAHFDDGVYIIYRFAQNLAGGRGLAHDAGLLLQTAPVSLLFIFLMAALEPIMPTAGMLLSAVGWGSGAIIMYRSGLRKNRPLATTITAILVTIFPLIPHTLGGPISWAIVVGWAAIVLAPQPDQEPAVARRDYGWLVALLLPVVYFDTSTVLLGAWLLSYSWRAGDSRLRAVQLILLTAVLGWIWFVSGNWGLGWFVRPFTEGSDLFQLLKSSELYWLYVPFMILAGWAIWQNPQDNWRAKSFLLWTALVWLMGSQLTGIVTAVAALILAGIGIDWLVKKVVERQIAQLKPTSLAFVLAVPLILTQLISLWQQYAARPTAQFALEVQLADWLQTNSASKDVLFAAPHIGFRAQRPTIPAVLDGDPLPALIEAEPDFIISADNIAWNKITRTGWFKARYTNSQEIADDYAPFSPLIVWQFVSSPYDSGEPVPISAVIPERLKMVGYKYEPDVIAPGDSIYLTVYLQATRPITVGFNTQVNLTYMLDEWVWAWKRVLTPHSVPGQLWQPGQIIPERFELETEETIPFGAYKLQILWNGADDGSFWPIYRDDDENILDRIQLGYIAVPPPVDDVGATVMNAQFGDQITLASYEISDKVVAGQMFEIILYWQAIRPPDDNYFVFVHLIDANDQLVTSHDEQPMNGRFATHAWQPGITVQDNHPLLLPPDLPAGSYQVMVGLYLQETGVRLPVWDAAGVEQVNGNLPLTSMEIE